MLNFARRELGLEDEPKFDRRGAARSPVTLPSYRKGWAAKNKGLRLPPEPLEAREVVALLDACEGRAAIRNRALITMYWRTGLRSAEALDLFPKDVDLERGRITVLHGKGNRRRVVPIDPAASAIVGRWEALRASLGFGDYQHYFCVQEGVTAGMRLQESYPRQLLSDLAKKAGVRKRVHPHGLRHTYASYLLDQGQPIHYIKRALGHSSIAITERYADHLNPAKVLEELRAVEWPE
jgi:integrase